jgi:hypothetical protein
VVLASVAMVRWLRRAPSHTSPQGEAA